MAKTNLIDLIFSGTAALLHYYILMPIKTTGTFQIYVSCHNALSFDVSTQPIYNNAINHCSRMHTTANKKGESKML
jgi:hypothetical protein